jgi:transcription antitermination factor NusG
VTDSVAACSPPSLVHPQERAASWYAFRVRPAWEFRARRALWFEGFEEFLPIYAERVRWSDRVHVTERPMFPGYLFAHLRAADISRALRIAGILAILPNASNPIAIADEEISNLRIAIASKLTAAPCALTQGARVSIKSGPLAGLFGVVTEDRGALRLVVNVEILRRGVSVELDPRDVEAA